MAFFTSAIDTLKILVIALGAGCLLYTSQQEKALEELGVELPDPSKPKGKHNNRKQTFDAV